MAQPLVELAQPAGVVVVTVGADRHHRAFSQAGDSAGQRPQAETGVDDQVAVPAPDVPDIAAPVG